MVVKLDQITMHVACCFHLLLCGGYIQSDRREPKIMHQAHVKETCTKHRSWNATTCARISLFTFPNQVSIDAVLELVHKHDLGVDRKFLQRADANGDSWLDIVELSRNVM
jgi:hypothetical protein